MASYKWAHEKKVRSICLPDFKGYKRNKCCDKKLCGALHKLLDSADIVVAHNGDAFDVKKINARLIINGYKPPSPYKTIDTLKISRRAFKFDSNKMDNIGGYLKIGNKVSHTGAPLWRGCVNGDPEAWSVMRIYCERDTELLTRAYDLLKSWAPNHPDMRLYGAKGCCPTCDSNNVQRRGVAIKLKSKYQRLQCRDCGAWFAGEKVTS
jgi:hypothetical protein